MMNCLKLKLKAYTLIELLIVMALSVIIISMISLALFLIQKQIEQNNEDKVYDYIQLMSVIDANLQKGKYVDVTDHQLNFIYDKSSLNIKFLYGKSIINDSDTLNVYSIINAINKDKLSGQLESFELKININNDSINILKRPSYSNSYIINNKVLDLEY